MIRLSIFMSGLFLIVLLTPLAVQAGDLVSEKDALQKVNREFSWYDPNGDGNVEIRWVRDLDIDASPLEQRRGTVLVIVEPRLMGDTRYSDQSDPLLSALRTYASDLPWIMAVYPDAVKPEGESDEGEWLKGGPTPYCETGTYRYTDFFFINDGKFTSRPLEDGSIDMRPLDDMKDEECSEADRQRGNPLARPDIFVSRIDARHIALKPKDSLKGSDGNGLLDENGKPRTVAFAVEKEVPSGISVWEWDPVLEKKLLVEYFERNHRYRRGEFKEQFKPAAIAFELDSSMSELLASRTEWKDFKEPGYDVHGEDGSLLGLVQWLKRPAIARFINAHSDPWGSVFKKVEDVSALEKECGGQPWSWARQGNQLVPTLGATGKLDFAVLRTLWQNRALPDTASFFLHFGCDIATPGGMDRVPYNHPEYAYWQGGEGLLFYGKGLSLIGRAKVFYDFPTDFARMMGEGRTFGEAWAHYHEVESAEKDINKVGGGIGRKRAYFWSVLGDWTLKLYPAGLQKHGA